MKPPLLILAATFLAWPAIGQAPIDPPVASLPVPSVAVESLAAAPNRTLARKPAPTIDDDVAEASPKFVVQRRVRVMPEAEPATDPKQTRFIRTAP